MPADSLRLIADEFASVLNSLKRIINDYLGVRNWTAPDRDPRLVESEQIIGQWKARHSDVVRTALDNLRRVRTVRAGACIIGDQSHSTALEWMIEIGSKVQKWVIDRSDFLEGIDLMATWLADTLAIDLNRLHAEAANEIANGTLVGPVVDSAAVAAILHESVKIANSWTGSNNSVTLLPPGTLAESAGAKPGGPSKDRQNDIVTTISTKNTPLQRSEIMSAMRLKKVGRLGHQLAWMCSARILVNIPHRGYWPANRPLPE